MTCCCWRCSPTCTCAANRSATKLSSRTATWKFCSTCRSYDFNWQHRYVLAEPRRLPAGTLIRCTAVYDNSAANPANPDPTATVRTGTQSWDEMFNGYFDVVLADQDLTAPVPWHVAWWLTVRSILSPGVCLLVVLACTFFLTRRRIGRFFTPATPPSLPLPGQTESHVGRHH